LGWYEQSFNAYLNWSEAGFKLPKLREEQKILATLRPEHVSQLVETKLEAKGLVRARVVALTILETGASGDRSPYGGERTRRYGQSANQGDWQGWKTQGWFHLAWSFAKRSGGTILRRFLLPKMKFLAPKAIQPFPFATLIGISRYSGRSAVSPVFGFLLTRFVIVLALCICGMGAIWNTCAASSATAPSALLRNI
jgi:hypothetical protein